LVGETTKPRPDPVPPTNPEKVIPGKVPTREQLSNMSAEEINELWDAGVLEQGLRENTIK